MRVLIVDDSPAVRVRLHALLVEAAEGIEVREAASRRDAIAAAREGTDVVILDLHLGEDSGLASIEALRAASPGVEIVVLTNDASEHHRRESAARGAVWFFDKSREFDRAVDLVVERARAAR